MSVQQPSAPRRLSRLLRVGNGQPRRSVAGHLKPFESLPKIENHIFLGLESVPLECRELQWQLVVIWRRDAQLSVAAQKWQDFANH